MHFSGQQIGHSDICCFVFSAIPCIQLDNCILTSENQLGSGQGTTHFLAAHFLQCFLLLYVLAHLRGQITIVKLLFLFFSFKLLHGNSYVCLWICLYMCMIIPGFRFFISVSIFAPINVAISSISLAALDLDPVELLS